MWAAAFKLSRPLREGDIVNLVGKNFAAPPSTHTHTQNAIQQSSFKNRLLSTLRGSCQYLWFDLLDRFVSREFTLFSLPCICRFEHALWLCSEQRSGIGVVHPGLQISLNVDAMDPLSFSLLCWPSFIQLWLAGKCLISAGFVAILKLLW